MGARVQPSVTLPGAAALRSGLSRRALLGTAAWLGAASVLPPSLASATTRRAPVDPVVPTVPHGLLTSLLATPLGIEDPQPRLSWVVPVGLREGHQEAYQVQVAHSELELERSGGVVWDSGRVDSADSVAVRYAGPALEAGRSYTWRVRTWTAPGRVTGWSGAQRVVTAAGATFVAEPLWVADDTVALADGRLDIDLTITGVAVGVFLRAQDINNALMWQLRAGTPGAIKPHVRTNGGYTVVKEEPIDVDVPVGSPFRLSIELEGDTVRTFVDDVLVDTTVTEAAQRYAAGVIGFRNGSTESQVVRAVQFTDPSGAVLVDEDFTDGPGVFAGGTVGADGLVVRTGQQLLAVLGEANDWALLRTEVEIDTSEVAAAWLHVAGRPTAPSRQYVYRAWMNGAFVGVGPARSVGGETRYQTHDVTDLLQDGRNAVALLGWAAGADRALAAQLVVAGYDGSHTVHATGGEGWRARRGAAWRQTAGDLVTGFFTAPSEAIDARREPVGWTEAAFDDSDDAGWETPVAGVALGELAPVPVEPMIERLAAPVEVVETGPGVWRIDLGAEIVGGVRLTLDLPDGAEGTVLDLRLGEEVQTDGRVRFRLRTGNVYQERWTVRAGPQVLEHWGYRGVRWIEVVVTGVAADVARALGAALAVDGAVQGVSLQMPWSDDEASFHSSDPDLDRVWELCRYSIGATRQDVYQDTPTRERGPYEGDAIINQLSEYLTQRSYGLARYSNHYLAHRPTWPTEYRIMGPLLVWEDYLATGDPDALATDYAIYVERNHDERINARGLLEKDPGASSQVNGDLVDWPVSNRDGYVFTRENTVLNAWQFAAYDAHAKIAEALGRTEDAAEYTRRAADLRDAINAALWDPERGVYRDGVGTEHSAQHATAFPAAFGVPEPAQHTAVGASLAEGGMRVSVYGSQFLLDGLYRVGRPDVALELMTSTDMSSWLHMIDDLDATIVAEAWDPSLKSNMTFSHAWGSAPGNVVGRRLVGVSVLEPGAGLVEVRPRPADLAWFSARVPTVRGTVAVDLDRSGQDTVLEVTTPGNVRARIVLDFDELGLGADATVSVRRRGRRPEESEQDGMRVYTAGPGTTTITVRPGRRSARR